MKQKTQFYRFRFPGIPCDIFGCYERAKWTIGRPDGSPTDTFKLCETCTKHLIQSIPDEILLEMKEESMERAKLKAQEISKVKVKEPLKDQLPYKDEDKVQDQVQAHVKDHLSVKLEAKATVLPSELVKDSLETLKVKDLKNIAKQQEIKGYSDMNKGELVEALMIQRSE